jgi:membrane-associated phospholipid phosphatase
VTLKSNVVYLSHRLWLVMLITGGFAVSRAQTAPPPPRPEPQPAITLLDAPSRSASLKSMPRNLFIDQKDFWLTPFRMTKPQWRLVVPLTFVGAGLLGVDTAVERHVPTSSSSISRYSNVANAGVAALVGVGGGMFLWGHLTDNEVARETGVLSGEAAINAIIDTTVFKYAFERERPFTGDGRGRFFQGGTSFPSQHSAISWAVASVIAHEYPGPATQILAYGVAGAVSAARVAGQKHFLSDALVGSALGWYIGRQVYRSHSEYSSADVAKFGTFTREDSDESREPRNQGSPYVPVDSWVYPVFDRLIAAGLITDRVQTIRPWSRLECARLLEQVHERMDLDSQYDGAEIATSVRDLDLEFDRETNLRGGDTANAYVELESVYSRYTGISGQPLRDSFHFAQSIANDFGRPYGHGSNALGGISTQAVAGPFLFYVRGEYQYGSSGREYTPAQVPDIVGSDLLPENSVPTFGRQSRFRTVEAYAGLNLGDWQLTFGQQSPWWGANRSTSLLLSNNAEGIPMLRIDRVSPLQLPGVLKIFGPIHVSAFLGRIGGYRYLKLGPDFQLYGDGIHLVDPQPYLWGANIAFKPTPNLELAFSITTLFAGRGRPLTLKTFLHSFSQHGNLQPVEPGDRSPMISASYRLPGLRNLVTVYADSMSETQPFPLFYPLESALNAGIYFVHVPRLKKLDFRCEGIYTNIPGHNAFNNSYFVNAHYAEGDRNRGQLYTSWIGRGGNGGQMSSTYWFSARDQATVTYRRMVSNSNLLRGGNVNDVTGSWSWMLKNQLQVAASMQYERWNFPFLSSGPQNVFSTTLEFRFWPKFGRPANRPGG